jgi:hypothetical protein
MKSNAQLLDEITAAMATAWLAACERRVIGTTPEREHVVIDVQQKVCLFGPAGKPSALKRATLQRRPLLLSKHCTGYLMSKPDSLDVAPRSIVSRDGDGSAREPNCSVLVLDEAGQPAGVDDNVAAPADECRDFIHRAAALDVLRMLGTERVAGAALVAGGHLPVTLNG